MHVQQIGNNWKIHCNSKFYVIKYCAGDSTINNSIFEINLNFVPNGDGQKGGRMLSGKLKFSRRDLQILVGVFLIDVLEYW